MTKTINILGDSLLKDLDNFPIVACDADFIVRSIGGANVGRLRTEIEKLKRYDQDLVILVGTNEIFKMRVDDRNFIPSDHFNQKKEILSKLVNLAGFCSKKFKNKNIHFLAIPPRGKMNTVNFIEILNDEFKSKISYCGANVYFGDLDYGKFKDNLRGGVDERFYREDLLHFNNFGINHLGNLIRNYLVDFYCGAKMNLTFDLGQARLSSTMIESTGAEEDDSGAKDKGTGKEQNFAASTPKNLSTDGMSDQTLVPAKNFKKINFKFEKKLVEFKSRIIMTE